jgi:glycine cleavage system H protein
VSEENRKRSNEEEYISMTVDKFVFKVSKKCLYSDEGVWIRIENNVVRIGIADFVQKTIGDITFITLPKEGDYIGKSQELVLVESIKAITSLLSPITGSIKEVNYRLDKEPELVNQDPFGLGWMVIMKPSNFEIDRNQLLEAVQYLEVMKGKIVETERGLKKVI